MSAYIIARITVTDPEGYKAYASQTAALAEAFGGRFLVCLLYTSPSPRDS